MNSLVSIITPCYNSGQFIGETIESVLSQSYQNWEMIIVDDCSTDISSQIIRKYAACDSRIKYLKTEVPSGSPTLPRNIGIKNAAGRFIAFLDSDDIWLPTKLSEQIKLFDDESVAIVYANYEKVNEKGDRNNRIIIAPFCVSYRNLLKGNVIGCLTAIFDVQKVGKIFFQKVGHEDFVMWLSILKKGFVARNTNTVLALYRVQNTSLSSNKLTALSWTWNIYRNIENLPWYSSCFYFLHYAFRSGLKYLK